MNKKYKATLKKIVMVIQNLSNDTTLSKIKSRVPVPLIYLLHPCFPPVITHVPVLYTKYNSMYGVIYGGKKFFNRNFLCIGSLYVEIYSSEQRISERRNSERRNSWNERRTTANKQTPDMSVNREKLQHFIS